MNKVVLGDFIFSDYDVLTDENGKLINGNYYSQNSLSGDTLTVDTIKFSVRFPLTETPDTSITKLPYATECLYYQDGVLFGKYYLVTMERTGKHIYNIECQSAIGLLKDTTHYGDIYSSTPANEIIKNIINDRFSYTIDSKYSSVELYGWLPIATSFENLQQVLYACGGCVKKTEQGDPYFTFLGSSIPTVVSKSRTYDSGKVSYNSLTNKVNITEHSYVKSSTSSKELYKGKIYCDNITTPQGHSVYGAIVTFSEPCYNISVSGGKILNNEYSANYCVVESTTYSREITVTGYPYTHITGQIEQSLSGYTGKDKVASVTDATLVSPANSTTIAQRTLAYYSTAHTLTSSIISEGEKPLEAVAIQDPFGDVRTGYIESVDGTFSKNMVKSDIEVALDYDPPTVSTRKLDYIEITTPPDKTVYGVGQYFNPAGMVVTAYYAGGKSLEITNYQYSPTSALTLTDTQITITYSEGGINRAATQEITFSTQLVSIAVTQLPDQTIYNYGDTFNPSGMIVTAYYSNNTSKILNNNEYTWTPNGPMQGDTTTVAISYTDPESDFTAQTYVDISFGNAPELADIIIDIPPDKTVYAPNESFDPTGMVVTGIFSDESARELKGYTWSPVGPLGEDTTQVTISVEWQGVVFSTQLDIAISSLMYIEVATPPLKTSYYEGDLLDTDGMVVYAYYSDGTSTLVPNSALGVSPSPLKYKKNVTLSYSNSLTTCYVTLPITVDYHLHEYTKSIILTRNYSGNKLKDVISDITNRNIRINIINQPEERSRKMFDCGTGGSDVVAEITNKTKAGTYTWTSNAGAGGYGKPIGGEGGKVYSKDIVVEDWDSSIITTGTTNYDKYFTVDGNTYYGSQGEVLENGFTDIFTNKTYATKGEDAWDTSDNAVHGGSGGGAGSDGEASDYGVAGGKAYNNTLTPVDDTYEYHNTEYIEHAPQRSSYYFYGSAEEDNFYYHSNHHNKLDENATQPEYPTYEAKVLFEDYIYKNVIFHSDNCSLTWDSKDLFKVVQRSGSGLVGYYSYRVQTQTLPWPVYQKYYSYVFSPIIDVYLNGEFLATNAENPDIFLYDELKDYYCIEGDPTPIKSGETKTITYREFIFEAYGVYTTDSPNSTTGASYPIKGYCTSYIQIAQGEGSSYTYKRDPDTVINTDYGVNIKINFEEAGGGGGGYASVGGNASHFKGGNGGEATVATSSYTNPIYGGGVRGTTVGGGGGSGGKIVATITELYPDSIGYFEYGYKYTLTGGEGGSSGKTQLYNYGGPSAIIVYYS